MKNVGIGVIGCGGRIAGLLELLLPLSRQLNLVAVCDPRRRVIEDARRRFNPAARFYSDYRQLVRAADVDWVMIGSWNCFHAAQAIAALRAGKHVFCEKPLATTLTDCQAVRRAWRQSGRQFALGFTLRYSPHYRKIKELVEQGAVGEIISLEMNETLRFNHGGYFLSDWRRLRRNSGGYILEKCCHDIDLANWITGSLPVRVASFGGRRFFVPRHARHIRRLGRDAAGRWAYRTWPMAVPRHPFLCRKDLVDHQTVIWECANGVRATFHTNANAAIPERRLYICGSEGALRADVISGELEWARIGFKEKVIDAAAGAGSEGGHGGGDPVLCCELLDSMLHGRPPAAGLEEGFRSAVVCLAIDEALERGSVINLRPLWRRFGAPVQ